MGGGDFNKSLKGEGEKLIKEVCQRGNLVPWLCCFLGVDEIDAAVPARSEGGGSGGDGGDVGKVCAFLNMFGGGQDVPNLLLIGATNRREAIDEAVRRRLEVSLFVGYLSQTSRMALIQSKLFEGEEAVAAKLDPLDLAQVIAEWAAVGQADLTKADLAKLLPRIDGDIRDKIVSLLQEARSANTDEDTLLSEVFPSHFASLGEFWSDELVEILCERTMNFSAAGVEQAAAACRTLWLQYLRHSNDESAAFYPKKCYLPDLGIEGGNGLLTACAQMLQLQQSLISIARSLDFKLGMLSVPELHASVSSLAKSLTETSAGQPPAVDRRSTGLMLARLFDGKLSLQCERWSDDDDRALDSNEIVLEERNGDQSLLLATLLKFANTRELTRVVFLSKSVMITNGA